MLPPILRETREIVGISEQVVRVYIADARAQDMLEFGNAESGSEEHWLAFLPSALRTLAGIA